MGFLQVLTLIFITLKLMGYVTWSWWLVLSPAFVGIVIYTIIVTMVLWSKGLLPVIKRKR